MMTTRRWMAASAVLALAAGCTPAAAAGTAGAPVAASAGTAVAQTGGECEIGARTLVDVRAADRTIRTDVRYATRNNFTGDVLPGYERPLALLRPPAAEALARVQARLRARGLGLKVFDAYRPVRATLGMVDWAERTNQMWVIEQGYVARQSGHNVGRTVDLTLVNLRSGRELDMGTEYDTFSAAAHTANASGQVAENRRILVEAMAAEGFQNYDKEWWHFSIPGPREPLDVPLRCFG